jgi:hypothetical protein
MPSPASPGTNQYRCQYCDRHFNSETELDQHQTECRAAYQSGAKNKPAADRLKEGDDREWKSVP